MNDLQQGIARAALRNVLHRHEERARQLDAAIKDAERHVKSLAAERAEALHAAAAVTTVLQLLDSPLRSAHEAIWHALHATGTLPEAGQP